MKIVIEKIITETHDLPTSDDAPMTVGQMVDHMLMHAVAADQRVVSISVGVGDEEWSLLRGIVREGERAVHDRNIDRQSGFDSAADAVVNAMLETPSMAANPKMKLGRKMRVVPVNK